MDFENDAMAVLLTASFSLHKFSIMVVCNKYLDNKIINLKIDLLTGKFLV